jgi:hypothetical protein
VALIGGGTFGYLASQAKSDFDKEPWADKANSLKTTAESRALTANILFGIGGAALAGAIVLFFVEGGGGGADDDSPASASVGLSPFGFEATLRF